RAGHPRGATAVLESLPNPGFGIFLPALRDCVKPPHTLSSGDFEGIDETAQTFFSSGNTGYYQVSDDHGSWTRTDSLLIWTTIRLPKQGTRSAVQREETTIVKTHKKFVLRNRNSTVRATARFTQNSLCM